MGRRLQEDPSNGFDSKEFQDMWSSCVSALTTVGVVMTLHALSILYWKKRKNRKYYEYKEELATNSWSTTKDVPQQRNKEPTFSGLPGTLVFPAAFVRAPPHQQILPCDTN